MFEQAFKNIDDVRWKEAGCATELDYTEQTSWLLFLKYLDGLVKNRHRLIARLIPLSGAEEMEAVLEGRPGNIRASSQHCFQGC